MSTGQPAWWYVLQRALCVGVFTCAGFFVGLVGRIPAYGLVNRLLAVGSPAWARIAWFVVRHDNEIGETFLILGTVLGLLAGILVLRAAGRRPVPRSAFALGVFCFCAAWILAFDFKLLALPAWIAAIAIHYRSLHGRAGARRSAAAWLVFVAVSVIPLDVSVANYPGPPRFVRVATGGYYSAEGYKEAREGKFFLDELAGRYPLLTEGTWILIW